MDEAGDDVGGGIEQARHPGQEIARPQSPDTISADPLGLGDDEGDPATDQRAMDQARVLGTARTVYAMDAGADGSDGHRRSEEHTSELQSLMRISYAVFCLKKKRNNNTTRDRGE